jgi:hypothetical protein
VDPVPADILNGVTTRRRVDVLWHENPPPRHTLLIVNRLNLRARQSSVEYAQVVEFAIEPIIFIRTYPEFVL